LVLDIGIGNGDLTKMIATNFVNLTIVDTTQEALDNMPDRHGLWNRAVTKILQPIETLNFQGQTFDLIVLSHILYYVDPGIRIEIVNKLYNILNPKGSLLLIYNSDGTRSEMVNDFNGTNFNFDQIYLNMKKFDNVIYKRIDETIEMNDLCNMLTICGVCMHDAGTTASFDDLKDYVEINFLLESSGYSMTMEQNIFFITHD